MIVSPTQIFNLMDTNGRRSDVLNALKVYLEILEELQAEYPGQEWATYPASTAQFRFYEKALEKSPEVFRVHKNYDDFLAGLGDGRQAFLQKDPRWMGRCLPALARTLDQDIEKRARHYSSNLVKMGFTDERRNITEAGFAYLRGRVTRDPIEALLPLDDINILLIRQLAKLKIFSESGTGGTRRFYSPFFMALALLTAGGADKTAFEVIVQGLGPYSSEAIQDMVRGGACTADSLEAAVRAVSAPVPAELTGDLSREVFFRHFRNAKSSSAQRVYYGFYLALKNFRDDPSQANYAALLACFEQERDSAQLNKAFGYGKAVFQTGNRGNRYDLATFLEKNRDHSLLTAGNFAAALYTAFSESKRVDGIREYSDTTIRLLSATGLFRFRNLPELAYPGVLERIFAPELLRQRIFGTMSEAEFSRHETEYLGKNTSLTEILGLSGEQTTAIVDGIRQHLHAQTGDDARRLLLNQNSRDFQAHVLAKYPREKIMELLPLFSDRNNDARIRREVNDAASVPTIYEYIIGIAWFYISGMDFDLYGSLNLTLNADFEPVFHAGGGEGDIVIPYDDMVIMLEVTMMNQNAQKRAEWEPVLRHSLNLKAASAPKPTFTFFVADVLDRNTINIWRAVAAVPLESTDTHRDVDGVVIMPLTNGDILRFLEQNIPRPRILQAVQTSFGQIPRLTDTHWHQQILATL